MLRKRYAALAMLCAMPVVAGCAFHRDKNPHNDVLVFATQTKFGVDVSAPATNATLPALNIGYNRTEAVWMPLRPNGTKGKLAGTDFEVEILAKLQKCEAILKAAIPKQKQRNAACLASVLPRDKYVSMSSGVNGDVGGKGLEIDTYSVFASFGARGSVSGSEANGGLAQLFATGIAAQRLASNPQVGNALNTAAPKAIVAQQFTDAQIAMAASNNSTMSKLKTGMSGHLNSLSDQEAQTFLASFEQKSGIVGFTGYCGTKSACLKVLKTSLLDAVINDPEAVYKTFQSMTSGG